MPHFDEHGGDTWLCQRCTNAFPSTVQSLWIEGTGNVCLPCCADATEEEMSPKLELPEDAVREESPNVLTHNGTFTVKSIETGGHRTFRVRTQPDDARFAPGKRIVSILTGPDNYTNYKGFGFVEDGQVHLWSRFSGEAVYVKYARMLENLERHAREGTVEVYAATRCRVCNRKLTTPESVKSGIGPVCENRVEEETDADRRDELARLLAADHNAIALVYEGGTESRMVLSDLAEEKGLTKLAVYLRGPNGGTLCS